MGIATTLSELESDARKEIGSGCELRLRLAARPSLLALDSPAARSIVLAEETARSFGAEVIYIKNVTPEFGQFSGAYKDGKIFVDVDTRLPHHAVIGHELLHFIRRANDAAYWRLCSNLEALLPFEAGDRHHELARFRFLAGVDPAQPAEYAKEELIAELLGRRFLEPEFLDLVAKERGVQPITGATVADFLIELVRLIAEFLQALQQNISDRFSRTSIPTTYWGPDPAEVARANACADEFVSDLCAARRVLADFLRDAVTVPMPSVSPGPLGSGFARHVTSTDRTSQPSSKKGARKRCG